MLDEAIFVLKCDLHLRNPIQVLPILNLKLLDLVLQDLRVLILVWKLIWQVDEMVRLRVRRLQILSVAVRVKTLTKLAQRLRLIFSFLEQFAGITRAFGFDGDTRLLGLILSLDVILDHVGE